SRRPRPTARPTSSSSRSDHANVLRLFSLAAGSDVELNTLTFVERLVATPLDVGEVDEHIIAVFPRDKAEALLRIEELHGTCSQCTLSLLLNRSTADLQRVYGQRPGEPAFGQISASGGLCRQGQAGEARSQLGLRRPA